MATLIKINNNFNKSEERVIRFFEKNLPVDYTLLTNAVIHQRNKPYEIDCLVLTLNGIFILEIKNLYGIWYQSAGVWIADEGTVRRNNPFNLLDTKAKVLRSILIELNPEYKYISCVGLLVIANNDEKTHFNIDKGYQRRLFRLDDKILNALSGRDFLYREDARELDNGDFDSVTKMFSGFQTISKTIVAGNWLLKEELGSSKDKYEVTDYLSLHKVLNKKAIVRIFDLPGYDKIKRDEMILRIKKEQKALECLEGDDGILDILDSGVLSDNDDQIYIATKYTEWPLLSDLININHFLPPNDIIGISLNILDTIQSFHKKGIIHRGLSPDCINVNIKTKKVKISHFDIARIEAPEGKNLTFTFKVPIQDYSFSSPEVLFGISEISPKVDFFSFGKILSYMLTHRTNVSIDDSFGRIIEKCTSISPSNRYENTEEIIKDLEEIRKINQS